MLCRSKYAPKLVPEDFDTLIYKFNEVAIVNITNKLKYSGSDYVAIIL